MLFRKLGIAFALLACIVIVVAYTGREMIKSSSVYEDARRKIEKQFGVPSTELSMPLLRTFRFSEGSSKGTAEFVLCGTGEGCYQVNAKKVAGYWSIVIAGQK